MRSFIAGDAGGDAVRVRQTNRVLIALGVDQSVACIAGAQSGHPVYDDALHWPVRRAVEIVRVGIEPALARHADDVGIGCFEFRISDRVRGMLLEIFFVKNGGSSQGRDQESGAQGLALRIAGRLAAQLAFGGLGLGPRGIVAVSFLGQPALGELPAPRASVASTSGAFDAAFSLEQPSAPSSASR